MENKSVINKILVIAGTVLVWLPILAPILFSLEKLSKVHIFQIDYLMPAELFPAILLGGLLLIWTTLRARTYRKLIGWSFGVAAGVLIGSQVLAVVTGLASGKTEPVGIWWVLVLVSLFVYLLAVVAMGIGGILLLCELFKPVRTTSK